METIEFYNKIEKITQKDNRYSSVAYEFINDAIIFTVQKYERAKGKKNTKHVSGKELLDGVRAFALKQFGPMAYAVFLEWGIKDGQAVGNIVFNMIEHNILCRSEQDTISDFQDVLDFKIAFCLPYLPQSSKPIQLPIIA